MKIREFENIRQKIRQGESGILSKAVGDNVYTRKFVPEERLILLGAGHIAQPLCKMASMLDYSVTVVDDRFSFANTARFPEAEKVICEKFSKAISELAIRSTDNVCVITRGHRWDGLCLREIFKGTQPSYLGMIGSKRRVAGLLQILEEEGFSKELLDSVHAPIGLKINALTPAEIALSICGELVAHRRKNFACETAAVLEQTNADMEMLDFIVEGSGGKAVMTVLESTGSTPVKPGAMMAVDAVGGSYGTIGGGCSEAEMMRKARSIIGSGGSEVVEVDMSNDMAEEEGMVCGGHMWVLVEDMTETETSM